MNIEVYMKALELAKTMAEVRKQFNELVEIANEEHGQAIGLYTITDELEVIGNIYENPELLKENTK